MIDLFEQCLKKIDLSSCGRGYRDRGTELVTLSIENFAREQKFEIKKEVFLGLKRKKDGYKGFVDIIIKRPDGIRYAIEIDSSNKKWSLEKLLHAHSIGYVPIWIRWCAKVNMEIPAVINLIDLTNKQR